jgi:hypothetical protein
MPTRRMTAPTLAPAGCAAKGGAAHQRGIVSRVGRWALVALLVTTAPGCGPQIEEEPPIPAHRYEPSETWCALMFDPVCPAQAVEVETEEECFEGLLVLDVAWAPVGVDQDACAATFIPYVDCLASLSCDEIQQHFALTNIVPPEERSSCGGLLQAQLDCQSAHY